MSAITATIAETNSMPTNKNTNMTLKEPSLASPSIVQKMKEKLKIKKWFRVKLNHTNMVHVLDDKQKVEVEPLRKHS